MLIGMFTWFSMLMLSIFFIFEFYDFYNEKFDEFLLVVIAVCMIMLCFAYIFLMNIIELFKERKEPFFEFMDNSFCYRDLGSLNYKIVSLSNIDSVRFSGYQVWFVYITLTDKSVIVIRTDELNIDNKVLMKGFQDFAKLQPAFGWDWTDLRRVNKSRGI